jgi:hypothetical protein
MVVGARSAIPRVIGVMAIVFACIGFALALLFGLAQLRNTSRWDDADEFSALLTWYEIWLGTSIVLFALHLFGGVFSCMYRKLGLRLLTAYGIGAVALVIIDLVSLHYMPDMRRHDRHGLGILMRGLFDIIALPWPIVVLALVNLRRSRMACR